MLNEFEIIKKYFSQPTESDSGVVLGSGDDAALLKIPSDQLLAVSTDTLVSDVHFFPNVPPETLGHKVLAVNLSDLAAMGAKPSWVTLCLTMPSIDEQWVQHFSRGFYSLANKYHVSLVGGDLTKGPLAVTAQVGGYVPKEKALTRHGAKVGDLIYVSNVLGDAGVGLKILQDELDVFQEDQSYFLEKLYLPQPQIGLGVLLRGMATSAIDISDGFAADLNHLLAKSHVGATVCVDDLPLSKMALATVDYFEAVNLALSAGDDYELCFTVSPNEIVTKFLSGMGCYCIGKIENEKGLRLVNSDGSIFKLSCDGYMHWR